MCHTKVGLISQLTELSQLTDTYRSRAYHNAAITISTMSEEEYEKRDSFTDIYGIGDGINNKILEYRETGVITKLQTLRAESAKTLDSDLYKVREGFITKKLTYEQATDLVMSVFDIIGYTKKFIVAGSFRRHKSMIGDIDLMVPSDKYEEICDTLDAHFKKVSHGDYKSQYLIDSANNVPMDVIAYTDSDFVFQLLYLTGSKDTNIRMRKVAASKGMLLNQKGLYYRENNQEVITNPKTEKEVFDALGMVYIAPELR